MARPTSADAAPERLGAPARREALLDVALALVGEGGPAEVTMGTVAERAEVTRALVYKHFANRDDILRALYQREAAALDRAMRRQVDAAPAGLEAKLRAFVGAVLGAVGTHAELFTLLRAFGRDPDHRRAQRSWDRRTVDYFAGLAADELGVDEARARPAVVVLLSGCVTLLTESPAAPGPERRRAVEDLLVEMALGSLGRLAAQSTDRR